jgi:type IV secretion system protein VirB2
MIRSVQIHPDTTGHIDQRCGLAAKRPAAPSHPSLLFRCSVAIVLALIVLMAMGQAARAAGSGLPWEAPLERILESIEGPVAKVIAVLIIIVTGLSLAFGDMSGGFRRLIQIVFGLTIAFAATSFFLTFFSFAGGALIN